MDARGWTNFRIDGIPVHTCTERARARAPAAPANMREVGGGGGGAGQGRTDASVYPRDFAEGPRVRQQPLYRSRRGLRMQFYARDTTRRSINNTNVSRYGGSSIYTLLCDEHSRAENGARFNEAEA